MGRESEGRVQLRLWAQRCGWGCIPILNSTRGKPRHGSMGFEGLECTPCIYMEPVFAALTIS